MHFDKGLPLSKSSINPPKKINVIIPFIYNTGGIKLILEHSRFFQENGYVVTVFYPFIKYKPYYSFKEIISAIIAQSSSPFLLAEKIYDRFFTKNTKKIALNDSLEFKKVFWISRFFIPSADIIIATSWPTAISVAKLPNTCGEKFYFIQGYETWGGYQKKVESTYHLPLKLVTISPWLTGIVERVSKRKISKEIHNGINLNRFQPAVKIGDKIRILMPYHTLPQKASKEGIEILKSIAINFPDIEINIFGLFKNPHLGSFYTYYENPNPNELLGLYQQSHIMLYPSIEEGWGLSILEAMACKCAVVANKMGCVPVLYNGKNMLVSESFDFGELKSHITLLIQNPEIRSSISEGGYQTALQFDVKVQAQKFMELFLKS